MDPLKPGLKWTKRRRRRTSRARARSGLKVTDFFQSHLQCPQPQPVSAAFLSQGVGPRTGVVPQPGPRYHFLPDTSVTGQWGQSSPPPMKWPRRKAEQQALSCSFQSPNMLHGSVDITQDPDEVPREKVFGRVECVSPMVLLSQLHPRLRFSCVCERPRGEAVRSFVVLLWLEGRVFEGCGRSKGVAKARAAACALYALHRLHPEAGLRGGGPVQQMHQLFAESICVLVTEKSRVLSLSSSSASPPLHKGLAGIVMTTGLDLRLAQVVAMATGTKYFSLDSAVEDGLTVRDCHAEALCRRALLCFLYDQLELLLRGPSDAVVRSTFVPVPGEGAIFRLRDDIQLHMFLNCPPCGDARLHWPYTNSMAPKRDKQTRRWSCGVRVKVSGGEGTVPVSQPGTARLSMSCTDKMAKWCVAGVQGALLSHLVEPIYLHSVTIATQSHPGHVGRVLQRRLAPVKWLQFPYRRQMFLLGCVGCCHPLSRLQGAHVSLSWTQGQGSEVIRVSNGRQAHGEEPSRLCPGAMFQRWTHIYRTITGDDAPYRTCSEAKMAAADYQRALRRFRAGLKEAGLWDRTPRLYP